MIYLDNAATTFPKPECVYLAMDNTNRKLAVNAGRGSYRIARNASSIIVETKDELRKLVHAEASAPVIFSSSITLALNQIANGIEWQNGSTVYISPFEHNAVARTLHRLEDNKKIKICMLPVNAESLEVDLEKMKYMFSQDKPFAVFCSHVSNVTGYILPIKEIFEEAKKQGAITVVDTAQSLGLIEIDSRQICADIIAFAGHKTLYGPFGIGGFINIAGIHLSEFITGGTGSDSLNLNMPNGPEARYEASSCNIVAIAGLNAALKNLNIEKCINHERELTSYLIDKLSQISKVKMFLPKNRSRHVGIVSFIFEGMNSNDIGTILDEDFDIAVRTGYHCAPFIHNYLKDTATLGTVRVGLGQFNTKEDIDALAKALEEIDG